MKSTKNTKTPKVPQWVLDPWLIEQINKKKLEKGARDEARVYPTINDHRNERIGVSPEGPDVDHAAISFIV